MGIDGHFSLFHCFLMIKKLKSTNFTQNKGVIKDNNVNFKASKQLFCLTFGEITVQVFLVILNEKPDNHLAML